MATTIKLKNGSGAPSASDLVQGEPAIDLTNKRLYTENGSGAVIEVGSNPSSLSIAGTAITATAAELNILDGVTSTAAELNILDGVTATAAELNIMDGVTSTTAELNILDGVTSTAAELNILDGVTSTAAELNILDGVTSTTAELNILDGVTSTTAELNILDGVTSTAAELNVLDGVTAFVDEDDMSSDSATSIPSQQSVKAYVDSVATASDLDFQADSGGALNIDLDSETMTFTGGTGIDTSGSGNAVTFAIDSTVATLTGSQSLTNKTLTSPVLNTGVSGTAVLDEDDMSSDSATQLATQQSIKAYVDSQVASADTLAELTDTNVTSPADAAVLFYDTGTSKWIDNVVSGDVTIADTGVAAIGSGVIVNDDVNASAAISVSKTALTAGTGITLSTDTLSVDASQTQITAVGTIGTGTWQGSVISDTYVANDLTISGGTIENTIIGASTAAAGTFTTFTSTGIDDNATSTAITIDSSQNVDVDGNLTAGDGTDISMSGTPTGQIRIDGNGYDGAIALDATGMHIYHNSASRSLIFGTNEIGRMRIDSSGRVGIGTTSPSTYSNASELVVDTGVSGGITVVSDSTSGGYGALYFADGTTGDEQYRGFIQYNHNNSGTDEMLIGTAGATRMAIDSSGGVIFKGSLASHQTNAGVVEYSSNLVSIHSYGATSGTGSIRFLTGGGGGSGTSEAMRITAGGSVLAGDSSTSGATAYAINYTNDDLLNIFGSVRSSGYTTLTYGAKPSTTTSHGYVSAAGNFSFAKSALEIGNGSLEFKTSASGTDTIGDAVTMTNRFSIDSSGNLLVGTTTSGSSRLVASKSVATGVYTAKLIDTNTNTANCFGLNIDYSAAAPNGSGNQFIYCEDSSALRMSVTSNGGISNYQAFDSNLSDQRAKKDIVESGDYLEKLCSIPVKNFRYNEDEENSKLHLGVIAQDVEAVAPEFVSKASWEYNEQQMDSVFNTDLMFAMMKSIQELSTQVNELKAEVAALKGA